jgi:hypothetical protein
MTTLFAVARDDLRRTRWIETPPEPLDDGGIRVLIESFALTANNITYAAFGDAMHYWDFFPTGEAGTGCVPVWGFGRVVESRCAEVAVGERLYGYWPMATDTVLHPQRCTPAGFLDGAARRRELAAAYNQYLRCSADPSYEASREAEQALLRPLFTTSFLIDDFLADNDRFGAEVAILSSASSKTAYGTAFCLAQRRGTPSAMHIVGLTSPANLAFTRGLGCYDEVLAYDAVPTLDPSRRAVYVDFSGSTALRSAVHHHLGDTLAYSCSVGGTHWDDLGSGKGLPGPRPTLFFAPAQAKKRVADWGPAGFQQRLAQAWHGFIAEATDPAAPWLQVERGEGRAAIERVYAALVEGRSDPRAGHVLAW